MSRPEREQLVALGVGLHEPVLDAVVDHLGEVAGAGAAGVDETAFRRQRIEHRLGEGDVLRRATDHEAVPLRATPHAATGAGVDVAEPGGAERLGSTRAVMPVGVAALDHHVALREQCAEAPDRVLGGIAGGHHHPHQPRGGQRGHQVLERTYVRRLAEDVVADHLVSAIAEAFGHVPAHAPESDHAQLHGRPSSGRPASPIRVSPPSGSAWRLRRVAGPFSSGAPPRGSPGFADPGVTIQRLRLAAPPRRWALLMAPLLGAPGFADPGATLDAAPPGGCAASQHR